MMAMKEKLDNLVKKYETKDFIKNDPIQFPHRFKNKADIEISAFISSFSKTSFAFFFSTFKGLPRRGSIA